MTIRSGVLSGHAHEQGIPISRYMEVRTASGPVYSHDGQTLYFFSNITGIPQVWALEESHPWPRQVTFFSDRVMTAGPSPVDNLLVINADQGGSENAQLFLTNANGVELQPLSADSKHIYGFGNWSPDGKRFNYTSNCRDGRAFDVFIYDVEQNEHTPVHVSDHSNYAGPFHPAGTSLLISRHHTNLNHDLFLVNIESGATRLVTPHDGEASFTNPQFSNDGHFLYLLTDLNSEFTRLARIDLASLEMTFLTEDQWDAENLRLSPDGQCIAFTKNVDGISQLTIATLSTPFDGSSVHLIPGGDIRGLPDGVIADLAWSPDNTELSITLSTPTHATEVWTVNLAERAATRRTFASVSAVPAETFVAPELIHYPSFDGLSIPAFYYRPEHVTGPYPVVVYVHGGPESQSRNSFNGVVQYFVNRGYAVLVPNVRGSSGYGRTYVHLDDVRKRMDSVADLAQAVDWLVENGNANRDAIAVMGGSYGGFMVLAAVTHYPSLWAAGVDIVGIANLRTFMENTSPYRRHLRECEYGSVENDGTFFDEISPIHHVNQITAPMIVIHGANDPRVPIGEAEQMVAALESRNHPVEYLRFEDEGHGVVKLPNRIVAYGQIAHFLDKHLSGRTR